MISVNWTGALHYTALGECTESGQELKGRRTSGDCWAALKRKELLIRGSALGYIA